MTTTAIHPPAEALEETRIGIEAIYDEANEFFGTSHGAQTLEFIKKTGATLPNQKHELGKWVILYTPPRDRPPLMLIGNHPSWFDAEDSDLALRNLESLTPRPHNINSYIEHDHDFALALRATFCGLKRCDLLESCVGLNQFWPQLGAASDAFTAKLPSVGLRAAWRETKEFCREGTRKIIEIVNPIAVALIGEPAQDALGPHLKSRKDIITGNCRQPSFGGRRDFKDQISELISRAGI